jgi:hypothetical protein
MKLGQFNIGILERIIRMLLGGLMIIVALTSISSPWSVWAAVLLLLGSAVALTGSIGTCPVYTLLKMNTSEKL